MMLTTAQKQTYLDQGFVLIPQAISADKIAAMVDALQGWIEESRHHDKNYGAKINVMVHF